MQGLNGVEMMTMMKCMYLPHVTVIGMIYGPPKVSITQLCTH